MKNLKNLFTLYILFVFSVSNIYPQTRNVIWVHGFNGDASAWGHYDTIFSAERKISSLRVKYTTNDGLDKAAKELNKSINDKFGNGAQNTSNLAIGHSMGGIMIREQERNPSFSPETKAKIGGYITIASPNMGAPVSDNILKLIVDQAAVTAFNSLISGPSFMAFPVLWTIISGFTPNFVAEKFKIGLKGDLASIPTNQDLKEGSNAINLINNFNSSLPRISIIAQENSPVHWRMIGTQLFGPVVWAYVSYIGTFPVSGDDLMVFLADQMQGVYKSQYLTHTSLAATNFFNPPAATYHLLAASKWKEGKDWFENSETIWSSLIKTSRVETYTYWIEEWAPCPPKPKPIPDCGEWVYVEMTGTKTVNYPSDGLLPTYAQELKGVSGSNKYIINSANHLELKNMKYSKLPNGQQNDGTKNTLNAIFDSYGWFNTPRN